LRRIADPFEQTHFRSEGTQNLVPVAAAVSLPYVRHCECDKVSWFSQLPAEVWIAVPRGARVPRVSAPPLRVVNISPAVFDLGIEEHRIEGQTVRIYSLARTVADCFRFRNKVGLDVALEALTEAWRSKRLKLDELNRIAKKLRVQRVMQPYLETVVM